LRASSTRYGVIRLVSVGYDARKTRA